MNYVITMGVHEGIVMAADRQVMHTACLQKADISLAQNPMEQLVINALNERLKEFDGSFCRPLSNSVRKLFTMGSNIGVAAGQQMYTNKKISVDTFINCFCRAHTFDRPKEAAEKLCGYIRSIDAGMDSVLMLAGYDKSDPDVLSGEAYRISINNNEVKPIGGLGFNYAGANDYFLQYCEKLNSNISYYSLQDAVDISKFAIDTCRGLEKHLKFNQAISDDIEMIAITHSGIQWVLKKELECKQCS